MSDSFGDTSISKVQLNTIMTIFLAGGVSFQCMGAMASVNIHWGTGAKAEVLLN